MANYQTSLNPIPKNIVILGAGFGGLRCALALEKRLNKDSVHQIVLIDKRNYQLFTPLIYEVVTAIKDEVRARSLKGSATIQIEEIISKKRIRFAQDEVTSIDLIDQKVHLKNESLDFEYLVLALGSEPNFYNIRGASEDTLYTLKNFDLAVKLRNDLKELVSHGEGTIIISGGGASGVEIAGELGYCFQKVTRSVISSVAKRSERSRGSPAKGDPRTAVKLILIESKNQLLSDRSLDFAKLAQKRLESLGVIVRLNGCIREINTNQVILENGESISGDIIIWAGGVKGNRLLAQLEIEKDHYGRVKVNEYLETEIPKVYALGDNASFLDKSRNKALPGVAYIAIPEGRVVAENIVREIRGQNKAPFFYRKKKTMLVVPIGAKWAIADLGFIQFSGFFAWLAKQLAELKYLVSVLPFFRAFKLWCCGINVYTKND